MDRVLGSPAMGALLRTSGLALQSAGKQKQTGTTQRWNPSISVGGRGEPIRTRIEFRHGPADPRRLLEAVPERVVAPYALRPPTVVHYTAGAAIEQEIAALALRSETQARDAFDLFVVERLMELGR